MHEHNTTIHERVCQCTAQNNELMEKKYKDTAVEIIERILKNTEHGLITINEGMKALCDPLDGIIL